MGTTEFLNNKREKTEQNNYVAAVYRNSASEVRMCMRVSLYIHMTAQLLADLNPSGVQHGLSA